MLWANGHEPRAGLWSTPLVRRRSFRQSPTVHVFNHVRWQAGDPQSVCVGSAGRMNIHSACRLPTTLERTWRRVAEAAPYDAAGRTSAQRTRAIAVHRAGLCEAFRSLNFIRFFNGLPQNSRRSLGAGRSRVRYVRRSRRDSGRSCGTHWQIRSNRFRAKRAERAYCDRVLKNFTSCVARFSNFLQRSSPARQILIVKKHFALNSQAKFSMASMLLPPRRNRPKTPGM